MPEAVDAIRDFPTSVCPGNAPVSSGAPANFKSECGRTSNWWTVPSTIAKPPERSARQEREAEDEQRQVHGGQQPGIRAPRRIHELQRVLTPVVQRAVRMKKGKSIVSGAAARNGLALPPVTMTTAESAMESA